jgi:hypothetical protein
LEKTGLSALVRCVEAATGSEDAPPRQSIGHAQKSTDGSRRPGESGFFGNFAVGHHVARFQPADHVQRSTFELGHATPFVS